MLCHLGDVTVISNVHISSTLRGSISWCHQATSHYRNLFSPISLSPYGVIRPQWVKRNFYVKYFILISWLSMNNYIWSFSSNKHCKMIWYCTQCVDKLIFLMLIEPSTVLQEPPGKMSSDKWHIISCFQPDTKYLNTFLFVDNHK